jgi:hypothetical protein
MKGFNPKELETETLEFVTGLIKKHGLGLRVKDGKIPEDFTVLTRWLLYAHSASLKLKNAEKVSEEIVTLIKKQNKLSIDMLEVKKIIKETDIKIYSLLECIEICEKNSQKIKQSTNLENFELDILKAELHNCESILKNCRGQKELLIEEAPISLLVDSLFVSKTYSPHPKILEYKKYNEDSFLDNKIKKNFPALGNTLENTYSEPSENKKNSLQQPLKIKCCGLMN